MVAGGLVAEPVCKLSLELGLIFNFQCAAWGRKGSFLTARADSGNHHRAGHHFDNSENRAGCCLSMSACLLQWWQIGAQWAWVWLLPLSVALGLALRWIHIYLRPLHRTLQALWALGCVGWGVLLLMSGPTQALDTLRDQPLWILPIGPLFAALTGIGFKEFFCFQRAEAIGLTLLLP